MKLAAIIILVVLLVAALVFWIRSRKKSQLPPAPPEAAAPQPEPPSGAALAINQQIAGLVDLVLQMKLSRVDQELCLQTAAVTRRLATVLPKAEEKYPGTELSWISRRIAQAYLPDLIKPYLDLSAETRDAQRPALTEAIADIDTKLAGIDQAFEVGDRIKFESQVAFLKSVLPPGTIEAS